MDSFTVIEFTTTHQITTTDSPSLTTSQSEDASVMVNFEHDNNGSSGVGWFCVIA
ncbi:mating type pheromone [Serpula lacrymans var. lacrymans S7.9]|uniref:Mating type pheromone n=1 Tax=Serpula lacrymans var. lacrymans (strain S7.9) TaxID=578457 RepID=F8NKI3_SERL9|nr:mating type pheromone [Serpula lacrymans var. lacrymans S7.9]EGO28927.1 mating type pheromone [Serpula lacrymans var. lacrymans S7.9]